MLILRHLLKSGEYPDSSTSDSQAIGRRGNPKMNSKEQPKSTHTNAPNGRVIADIVRTIQSKPDGATIDATTAREREDLRGFVVSITDTKADQDTEALKRTVRQAISAANLINRECFIGAWTDDAGLVYVDVSINTKSKEEAYTLARMFGQKAIWNANKQEVESVTQ